MCVCGGGGGGLQFYIFFFVFFSFCRNLALLNNSYDE